MYSAVENGDSVAVDLNVSNVPFVDGDFDAGVVAHEIGHGVSNRLVGGPSADNCLRNDEQMGEGWSDFFTLTYAPFAISDNPDGTEGRGIGNFSTSSALNAAGIRRKQYSTDMAVNNFTYNDIISSGTAPHPLGEIWATTLWDLYWAMVDEYGFDTDIVRGTGGNNLAVQLVVEGMKFTSCSPGLLEGRDGILAADLAVNDGANQCLIWEVFARRGMGFSANAGTSTNNRTDGRESFDISPYCIGGIRATKTVDNTIVEAGENVTYTIRVTNFDSLTAKNVVVTDEIPDGLEIDESSVAGADFTVSGNTITFTLGEIEFDDQETIRYTAKTDESAGTTVSFFDGAEDGDDNWEVINLTGDFLWEQADTTPYEGDLSWYIVNVASEQDQVLQTFEALPIVGANPGLRFWTKYDTEARWDAGLVEISTDGNTWESIDDKFLRNGYRG
ncbi:MAG: M36 family metallopeptidase, partial [Bacteroidota bacterium]